MHSGCCLNSKRRPVDTTNENYDRQVWARKKVRHHFATNISIAAITVIGSGSASVGSRPTAVRRLGCANVRNRRIAAVADGGSNSFFRTHSGHPMRFGLVQLPLVRQWPMTCNYSILQCVVIVSGKVRAASIQNCIAKSFLASLGRTRRLTDEIAFARFRDAEFESRLLDWIEHHIGCKSSNDASRN